MPGMDLTDWILGRELDDRFPLPASEPFTTELALSEGLTPRDLTTLVDEGLLRRPVKGVYVATAAGDWQPALDEVVREVAPHLAGAGHDDLHDALVIPLSA